MGEKLALDLTQKNLRRNRLTVERYRDLQGHSKESQSADAVSPTKGTIVCKKTQMATDILKEWTKVKIQRSYLPVLFANKLTRFSSGTKAYLIDSLVKDGFISLVDRDHGRGAIFATAKGEKEMADQLWSHFLEMIELFALLRPVELRDTIRRYLARLSQS